MNFSPEDLRDIIVLADAVDLLQNHGLVTKEWTQEITGFGFRPADYKEQLIDLPFLIVEVTLRPGDDNSTYVELAIIDILNRKATFRDSSRGIHSQILTLLHDRQRADGTPLTEPLHGIWVRRGLRFKEYPFTNRGTGETVMTRTYELDI
jgi:hypothetical protein